MNQRAKWRWIHCGHFPSAGGTRQHRCRDGESTLGCDQYTHRCVCVCVSACACAGKYKSSTGSICPEGRGGKGQPQKRRRNRRPFLFGCFKWRRARHLSASNHSLRRARLHVCVYVRVCKWPNQIDRFEPFFPVSCFCAQMAPAAMLALTDPKRNDNIAALPYNQIFQVLKLNNQVMDRYVMSWCVNSFRFKLRWINLSIMIILLPDGGATYRGIN